ncbi:21932_t:CDS:2, partial [Gigaspora rosea]
PFIDTSTIVSTEVDNMKLHKMVATWIINQQRLLSIVEDPELIEILQYLNPLYSCSKLSFTSDLWTSPNNKSYISVTAHYINENWALKEITIDFGLLSRKHNGVNIANGFFRILEDYNIVLK